MSDFRFGTLVRGFFVSWVGVPGQIGAPNCPVTDLKNHGRYRASYSTKDPLGLKTDEIFLQPETKMAWNDAQRCWASKDHLAACSALGHNDPTIARYLCYSQRDIGEV